MASRFEIVDEEYSEELKDKRENENMKNSTEWIKGTCKQIYKSTRTMSLIDDCHSLKHSEIE